MINFLLRSLVVCFVALSTTFLMGAERNAGGRPNVVAIMADDMGYSDRGLLWRRNSDAELGRAG
jgi:hypothetical protein